MEAITEAKDMGWNDTLNQTISQDGIDLKFDLKLLDFEWCLPNDKPTKINLTAEALVDMDNMSLPSFQTLGEKAIFHLARPITQVSDSAKSISSQPPHLSATVASDDPTMDSTITSRLLALETNWKQILQCLNTLAVMGMPPTHSGSGSTSIPPDQLTLGSAAANLGPRV